MKTIIIEGVIGWEVLASDIRTQLNEASGEDLDIQVSSSGGSVFEGNTIYDLILKYKRDFPGAKINITSYGISASQASIIALAGDTHIVHQNTAYIIHNAWSYSAGNHHSMRKTANFLEQISNMMARVYNVKTKKKVTEIKTLMDEETYYYGQEIIDAGFADSLVEKSNDKKTNKEEALALAQLSIEETQQKMKSEKFDFQADFSKAVALIADDKEIKIPASAGNNNNTEVVMNLEQLKKDYPELYAQVIQIGKDEEFDRVSAHITMGESANSLDIAVKHIKAKTGFSQAVSAEYMSAGMKNQSLQNRKSDNVTTGGQANTNDDEADTQALTQNILKKRGVKNVK